MLQVLCLRRVLPVLFAECRNADMIPFTLQNILVIADRSTKQEYSSLIFPQLVPLLKVKQPIQVIDYHLFIPVATRYQLCSTLTIPSITKASATRNDDSVSYMLCRQTRTMVNLTRVPNKTLCYHPTANQRLKLV